ncbi:hypothetical protein RJ641_000247 [Dillenia turbinata]|uniref:Uncharacterized protein n=1 Tax=Dillenia turbinata TaxID=194707 RepID=A0AAN8WBL1_9MAGN
MWKSRFTGEMDPLNPNQGSNALHLTKDGAASSHSRDRWMNRGCEEKKVAVHEEIKRMNQLPANSTYATHRLRRTASQDEELELLFAGFICGYNPEVDYHVKAIPVLQMRSHISPFSVAITICTHLLIISIFPSDDGYFCPSFYSFITCVKEGERGFQIQSQIDRRVPDAVELGSAAVVGADLSEREGVVLQGTALDSGEI